MHSAVPGVDRSTGGRLKAKKESSLAWLECEMNKGKRKPVLGRVLLMT